MSMQRLFPVPWYVLVYCFCMCVPASTLSVLWYLWVTCSCTCAPVCTKYLRGTCSYTWVPARYFVCTLVPMFLYLFTCEYELPARWGEKGFHTSSPLMRPLQVRDESYFMSSSKLSMVQHRRYISLRNGGFFWLLLITQLLTHQTFCLVWRPKGFSKTFHEWQVGVSVCYATIWAQPSQKNLNSSEKSLQDAGKASKMSKSAPDGVSL